ncbi:MAG: hypothetical protein A3E78_10800 [Alphaproteobacteria bacterium RIFCSPHIGHO2_12_FULL_63_12]|nr:MAG: hypothetical protein A3E78_10800 [Alphaproteobacteria bacterium RIFCSPHIGHO2_12_FULL_63_12]
MKRIFAATVAVLSCAPASAQTFDDAAMKKWGAAKIIHFEVVGVLSDKHVQIPPTDADLYADVVEKVTLSFDWDKDKGQFAGAPNIANYPATVSNLMGMEKGCPTGEINGAYEHFDVVSATPDGHGAIELKAKRKHPETMVAESCGAGRRKYAGAVTDQSTFIAPPDPMMFAYRSMMPKDGPVAFSADGKSMIMKALNNNWVWTYTPTAK